MDNTTLKAFLSIFVYQEVICALFFGIAVGAVVRRASTWRAISTGLGSSLFVASVCGLVAMSVVSSYIIGAVWRLWSLRNAFVPHGLFGGVAGLIAIFLVFTLGALIGALLDQWRSKDDKL